MNWRRRLRFDPIPVIAATENEALRFFTRRDLMKLNTGPVEALWKLPAVTRAIASQTKNGAWNYHGGREHIRSSEDYDQIETYRVLRELVEKYGLNRNNPTFRKAAEFMFSHQTDEGDFRGICGQQYVPYYSGAIMELLIKGGYVDDPRIERGFKWLISNRQDDGGWAFPIRTVGLTLKPQTFRSAPTKPDKRKPFSHLITGMVLRAFAAHPAYRRSKEARVAGELLAGRFFKADKYPDRRAPSFWTSFSYPFWFTDLLSSLDSISLIGIDQANPQVASAVNWFVSRQKKDGLWSLRLRIMAREKDPNQWITLAICRVFKRFNEQRFYGA
jgi:hypothetical protein